MIDGVLAEVLLDLLHKLREAAPPCDVLALKCYVLWALFVKTAIAHDELRIGCHVLSLLDLFALLLVFLVLLVFYLLLERLHRLGVDIVTFLQWHKSKLVCMDLLRASLLRFLAIVRGGTIRAQNAIGCKRGVDL